MLARRTFVAFALLPLSLSSQARVEAGRDYRVLNPAQPTNSPEKIEVLEFFSYGCGGSFYALESTGDLAKVDTALFDAIHKEWRNLFEERAIAQWLAERGVDSDRFTAAYRSFGVNTRLSRAEQMVRSHKVNEAPTLVVDGRYVPRGSSYADMLRIASELVAQVRAERKQASRN